MNFLRKLFGLTESEPTAEAPAAKSPAPSVVEPEAAALPELVSVFDEYGRERRITRDEWRRDHRDAALKAAWDNPNGLYAIVAAELGAGFAEDMLEPARRFAEICPDKASGAVLLGVTYFELGRLDEAAAVFEACLRDHGDHALVLVNYAKVKQRRGEAGETDSLLWRALQADPNGEHALVWAAREAEAREGAPAVASLLRKVAVLPGSWRAQLWLARLALDDDDLGSAKALYTLALSKVKPAPAAMLVQISGDLGMRGKLAELLDLVLPQFDASQHGLAVGSNLLRALLALNRVDEARGVIESLYRLKVPDWKQALDDWQKAADDRALAQAEPSESNELQLQCAPLEGPVWAMEREGFSRLLTPKEPDSPRIGIIAPSFTFDSIDDSPEVSAQREGREGVFGRSFALFLAEQVHLATSARGVAIFLRVAGRAGFVLSSAPYDVSQALSVAGAVGGGCTLVVNPHVDATRPLWRLSLQVIDPGTREVIADLDGACMPENPERTFRSLAERLEKVAVDHAGAKAQPAPSWAGPLTAEAFPAQMLARTQTLDVAVAALARDEHGPVLLGERQVFDSLLFQAVEQAQDPVPRLLLLTALARHRDTGSKLYLEYEERFRRLVAEHPQANPAAPLVIAGLNGLFARRA